MKRLIFIISVVTMFLWTASALAFPPCCIEDVPYDSTTWDGDKSAASKNAIRDKFETIGGLYGNVITVAESGGDYTDISEAVDAAEAGDTIKVYPGTYTDTITFGANNITVIGQGKANSVILTQANANVVDFNSRTGIQMRNMTIRVTAANSDIDTISGTTGALTAKFCNLQMVVADTYDHVNLDQPAIANVTGTGTFKFRIGQFTYTHPGDSAAAGIKAAFKATTGGTIILSDLYQGAVTTEDGALASTVMFDLYTNAIFEMNGCTVDVTDSTAGGDEAQYIVGIGYLGGSATDHEFFKNIIHVTSGVTSTGTYGIYCVSGATTTLKSAYNHIHCTGATANYGLYNGAGNTMTSHYDDIDADDDYYNAGTLNFVTSFSDGDLELSGTITAKGVVVESIPISWAEGGTSSPGGLTAKDQVKYRDFSHSADEDLLFEWIVPANLYEATANEVKVRVRGLISNATAPAATEGVAFQIGGCSMGDGDLVTCAEGTLVVSEEDDLNDLGADTQWDSWATGWVVVTIANLAAGETVRFSFNRDVDDAQDDYEQDIGVSWLEIKYNIELGSVSY